MSAPEGQEPWIYVVDDDADVRDAMAFLLEKVRTGLTMDARQWAQARKRTLMDERLEQLMPREKDVMEGMLAGKLNKLIADDLGVSVRTVEVHRAHVLEKIGARNSPDMVRMVLSSSYYKDWLA